MRLSQRMIKTVLSQSIQATRKTALTAFCPCKTGSFVVVVVVGGGVFLFCFVFCFVFNSFFLSLIQ